jgi:ribosomal protein S18 acetylase RimI-like enzyme
MWGRELVDASHSSVLPGSAKRSLLADRVVDCLRTNEMHCATDLGAAKQPEHRQEFYVGHDRGIVPALESERPHHKDFLFAVYASTRMQEMALTGWSAAQQEQFLRMQCEAQCRSYALQFPQAERWIVRHNDVAVGRMIVNRSEDEILLVDVALLPEHRNLGVGSVLMSGLMQEAVRDGKAIRLHVERFNPALRWYERLGFKTVSESAIYLEMTWRPGSDTKSSR